MPSFVPPRGCADCTFTTGARGSSRRWRSTAIGRTRAFPIRLLATITSRTAYLIWCAESSRCRGLWDSRKLLSAARKGEPMEETPEEKARRIKLIGDYQREFRDSDRAQRRERSRQRDPHTDQNKSEKEQ